MIDKKGENDFEFIYAYIEFYACPIFYVYTKRGEKDFESLSKKGEKVFGEKNFWFMHVYLTLFMHIYLFPFIHFIEYLFVYCYARVKGELL